ncbi:MAG: hypothetical protein P8Z74_11280 [Acidobacteriota bacterium]
MKSAWKYLRWLLLLLVILQLPFLFRLWETRQLAGYLRHLPERVVLENPFEDVRGSVHVHSAAGGHSLGTYPEIIQAAKQAGYRYIFITEHPREPALFNQIQDPDLVIVYGTEKVLEDGKRELVDPDSKVRILLLYERGEIPEDATGLEVFNIAESARSSNNLWGWGTWLYHEPFYPDLFFFHAWTLEPENFQLWDRATASGRKLSAVGGNDAHANIGLVVATGAGKRLVSVFVDPYVRSFEFLTNHLQLASGTELNVSTVVDALARGASYICFERIADPTGFAFFARNEGKVMPMGSTVVPRSELVFQSPIPVRFRLVRPGGDPLVLEGTRFEYQAVDKGRYRVEVYMLDPPSLLRGKPWILSNPIYVE